MALRPGDFRTTSAFAAPCGFVVWSTPSPSRCRIRCPPSALYTFLVARLGSALSRSQPRPGISPNLTGFIAPVSRRALNLIKSPVSTNFTTRAVSRCYANVITCRTALPSLNRSKPSLISSSFKRCVMRRFTGRRALLVELDEARQVARRHAGADVAALDGALFGDEVGRRHGPRRGGRRQSRGDRRAAAAGDAIRRLERARRAGHLDRVVDAALGRGLHLFDDIRRASR